MYVSYQVGNTQGPSCQPSFSETVSSISEDTMMEDDHNPRVKLSGHESPMAIEKGVLELSFALFVH